MIAAPWFRRGVLYGIIIKLGDSRDDSYISEPILELEGPFPSLILLLCSVCLLVSLVLGFSFGKG